MIRKARWRNNHTQYTPHTHTHLFNFNLGLRVLASHPRGHFSCVVFGQRLVATVHTHDQVVATAVLRNCVECMSVFVNRGGAHTHALERANIAHDAAHSHAHTPA
jgi:hypothetical protein